MTRRPDILIRKTGDAGRITLNRPNALNALTHGMILQMTDALTQWRSDPEVRKVLIDAAGDRAFCAGGDVAKLYAAGRRGDFETAAAFWRDEYRLNSIIAAYPKLFIAIMDGLVMGGGVGVSAHGRRRIVTERTVLAMPECAIGLIPDVGATLLLANAPGRCGEFIGLTGARLNAADCIYAGLADLFVASEHLHAFRQALVAGDDQTAGKLVSPPQEPSTLSDRQADIDRIFSGVSVAEIDEALVLRDDEWASDTLRHLRIGAPLSLEITLAAIRDARRTRSIADAVRAEYRFTSRAMEHGEFLEGVRAAVIDKDHAPAWRYPTLRSVPPELVATMRAPAPDEDHLMKEVVS